MRLLLDTHIFLALIERNVANLPGAVAAALSDPDGQHFLSAASLWEIAIKSRLGKLRLRTRLDALPELLDMLGVKIVAIDARHALASVEPEPATRDPFDRMLLAQCQVEGLRLVTIDGSLASHPLAARVSPRARNTR
ncbi:MAG: type II toxin-antitoxin system VapC family toxin [Roseiarcus sp.]